MSVLVWVKVKDWGKTPPLFHSRYEPDIDQFGPDSAGGIKIGRVMIPTVLATMSPNRGEPRRKR